jgi:hypothetical protein
LITSMDRLKTDDRLGNQTVRFRTSSIFTKNA